MDMLTIIVEIVLYSYLISCTTTTYTLTIHVGTYLVKYHRKESLYGELGVRIGHVIPSFRYERYASVADVGCSLVDRTNHVVRVNYSTHSGRDCSIKVESR